MTHVDELDFVQKLLAMGGNGALMAFVWLAYRMWKRGEDRLDRIDASVRRVETAIIERIPTAGETFRAPLNASAFAKS